MMEVGAGDGTIPITDLSERWRGITSQRRKHELYADDPYFREAWADLCARLGPLVFRVLQRTALIVLRPDALAARHTASTMAYLREHGLEPIAARSVSLGRLAVRELWRYQWTGATLESLAVCDRLLGLTPSVLVVLRDLGAASDALPASVRVAAVKGPTRVDARRETDLRSRLGSPNRLLTFVHVSDEPADVVREVGILFGRRERMTLIDEMASGAQSREVLARIAELEAAAPARALDPAAAISAIRAAVEAAAPGAERDQAAALLARGSPLVWTELCDALAGADLDVDVWDLVLVGTELVGTDEPDRAPVLPNPGAAAWLNGEGRVVG